MPLDPAVLMAALSHVIRCNSRRCAHLPAEQRETLDTWWKLVALREDTPGFWSPPDRPPPKKEPKWVNRKGDDGLTTIQLQVLALLSAGYNRAEVAQFQGRTEANIKHHIANIRRVLGVTDLAGGREQIVQWYRDHYPEE